MPSNRLVLCHPLLLLPSIFPSIRVFSNDSVLHIRWSEYWSFSFNISPSNEYSGLISFRMDWLDLLAVQGTLKSLLQHHSAKASILRCSAFFIVQLSHPYMTTEKTIGMPDNLPLHGCKLHHPCLETSKPLAVLSLSPNPSPCDTCKLTAQKRAVPVPGGWSSNPTLLTSHRKEHIPSTCDCCVPMAEKAPRVSSQTAYELQGEINAYMGEEIRQPLDRVG